MLPSGRGFLVRMNAGLYLGKNSRRTDFRIDSNEMEISHRYGEITRLTIFSLIVGYSGNSETSFSHTFESNVTFTIFFSYTSSASSPSQIPVLYLGSMPKSFHGQPKTEKSDTTP